MESSEHLISGSRRILTRIARGRASGRPLRAARVRELFERRLGDFPFELRVRDWVGSAWRVGGDTPHWAGRPLEIQLVSEAAGEALLSGDAMGFLECYLRGEVELNGNLYLLAALRQHAGFDLSLGAALRYLWGHLAFQNAARARSSVRSHYDVPQQALDAYLDRVYRAYSCGMFEAPECMEREELLRVGEGAGDSFDSLEKAQWRKFENALDWISAREGETLLEVGCGYGGQLEVALERGSFRKVVGWTHSANQVCEAAHRLARFDPERWEVREGDYRSESRVFDHITSTGMVSHVGPRGLRPYVRQVRRRIRTGGRYVHHALMRVPAPRPFDLQLGPVFHKRFVWPGFHWFTLGQHVRALERGGFEVVAALSLSAHYAKTTAAWYERMMDHQHEVRALLGDPTFRAWRLFLAGSSGDFTNGGIHVYRLFCRAV